jgi:hypothetical protein
MYGKRDCGCNNDYKKKRHDECDCKACRRVCYEVVECPKPEVRCEGDADKLSFCVPITFEQELVGITGETGTNFVPLSNIVGTTGNIGNLRGVLKLRFDNGMTRIKYALYVYGASINNTIIGAHIHVANSPFENGPVVVNLYSGPPTAQNGLIAKGVITNADIIPGTDANTIASLFALIEQRRVYVNVHTSTYVNGQIRGLIF